MLLSEISDGVWLALIAAVVTPLINMVVQIVMNTKMASNIQKIETATNSMKDALVEATRKEARQAGINEEKDRISQVIIDNANIEAEVQRRVTETDPVIIPDVHKVKENIEIIKEDVGIIKSEVTKE